MSSEIIRAIGALQGTVSATREEMRCGLAGLRQELRWHVVRLERRMDRGRNGRKLHPWAQIAAMAIVAISSILGLVRPDMAAMILRALLH